MYQPPHFREDDLSVQHALIRARPLGLLITSGDAGPTANLLPFHLDASGSEKGTLQVHMAKANTQWRDAVELSLRAHRCFADGAPGAARSGHRRHARSCAALSSLPTVRAGHGRTRVPAITSARRTRCRGPDVVASVCPRLSHPLPAHP